MIRTQVQLTEEQMAGLKAMAAKKGVSIAELVRRGVNEVLKAPLVSDEELRRRAIAFAGKYGSGLSDISENHDRYLEEIYMEKINRGRE